MIGLGANTSSWRIQTLTQRSLALKMDIVCCHSSEVISSDLYTEGKNAGDIKDAGDLKAVAKSMITSDDRF